MDESTDYSLLIQGIEDRLEAAGHEEERHAPVRRDLKDAKTPLRRELDFSISSILGNGSAKRPRLSEVILADMDEDDLTMQSNVTGVFSQTSGKSTSIKLHAKIDELKLTNEQLKEQLGSTKREFELFKEQAARQLKFMEDTHLRYKTDLDNARQKYYDEKKKWQVKTRELEDAVKHAARRAETVSSESSRVTTTDSAGDLRLQQRIRTLEDSIRQTQEDSRQNLAAKLELEKKVVQLEQSLRLSETQHSTGDEDTRSELRQLRRKYQELEAQYRRRSAEYEKLHQQWKNQRMLEEDLSSVTSKLKVAEETVKSLQLLERDVVSLREEKKTWQEAFHSILQQQQHQSASAAATADSVTPTRIAEFLRALQRDHLLLQSQHGETQRQLQQVRQELQECQRLYQSSEEAKGIAEKKLSAVESGRRALLQHKTLIESEVTTLRSLLQSFDQEFSIGRPEVTKVLTAKEEMLTALRRDLDTARQQLDQLLQQKIQSDDRIAQLEEELRQRPAVVPSSAPKENEDNEWKQKYDQLVEDYTALEEISGVDFAPSRTKVLHFQHNPWSAAVAKIAEAAGADASAASVSPSSLPTEVVRRYRAMTKDLQQKLASAAASASEQSLASRSQDSATAAAAPAPAAPSVAVSAVDQAKLNQRLKETFKERINQFREAVYLLTGFKMEQSMVDVGQGKTMTRLKLKSMYAESPDDCLIFQLSENGPELLESDFVTRMDEALIQYLQRYQSVPAFLSNVTLTLFENQTQMT